MAALLAACPASVNAASFSVVPITDRAGERRDVDPFIPLAETDVDAQLRFWPALLPTDVSIEGRFALEFEVAELGAIDSVESIRLALFPNAASFQGPATIDIAAYYGDGAITSNDFELGQKIAQPMIVTDMLPLVTDVTSFVTTAANRGHSHVGFVVQLHRLPTGELPFVPFVPFATKEFPNARFHPHLLVEDTSVPLPGDANGDGMVDRADVAALVSSFSATATGPAMAADFDLDGAVSLLDLMALQRQFEISPAGASAARTPNNVPEPHAIALLSTAFAMLMVYRTACRPGCPACLVPPRRGL